MKRVVTKKWIIIQALIGFLLLYVCYKFIDTAWIKWPLIIMIGGAFFYATKEDVTEYFYQSAEKFYEESKRKNVPFRKFESWGEVFKVSIKENALSFFLVIIFWAAIPIIIWVDEKIGFALWLIGLIGYALLKYSKKK